MARIKAVHDRLFGREVKALIKDLSRKNKTFAVTTTTALCDNCLYDGVHDDGLGKYKPGGPVPFTTKVCPKCHNEGKLSTETRRPLAARVRFAGPNQSRDLQYMGGVIPVDHALIKVVIEESAYLETATYFLIDGKRYIRVGSADQRGLLAKAVAEILVKRDE